MPDLIIDDFYDSYFKDLTASITGFGEGDNAFARIINLAESSSLSRMKNSDEGLSYPCLALEEFDDNEDKDDADLITMQLRGAYSVLIAVSTDDGLAAQLAAVKTTRILAKKVFQQMQKDSIKRTGNTLSDNYIMALPVRSANYVYKVAGGLTGIRTEFEWEVSGKLIQY